jgi:hypothetical protein
VVGRATVGYLYVKKQPPGWRGTVLRADARLGFAPVAGSLGAEILPGGFDVPARFDGEGLRVPVVAGDSAESGTSVLALGDSFTFGSGCTAEETYPALVARARHGRVLNAGFPGYGLAQMLVLARDLLPRHRPQLLLVQASTWLPSRAAGPFRSGEFDLVPVPYFAQGTGGAPELRPPRFLAKSFELPISRYRGTGTGLLDWGSFVTHVGFPLFFHDDRKRVGILAGRAMGRLPRGATERCISDLVYPELYSLCTESGTRMVVVVLDPPGNREYVVSDLSLPADVPVVDTRPALAAPLPRSDVETYMRAYGHWKGSPPRLVDEHPNAQAHAIIAEQVLHALPP